LSSYKYSHTRTPTPHTRPHANIRPHAHTRPHHIHAHSKKTRDTQAKGATRLTLLTEEEEFPQKIAADVGGKTKVMAHFIFAAILITIDMHDANSTMQKRHTEPLREILSI
jgi:hypothetical protein